VIAVREPPPPQIEIVAALGAPYAVFGPNLRFRRASMQMGTVILVLGVSFLIWYLFQGILPAVGGFTDLLRWMAAGLLALGGAAVYIPLSMRNDWVYVCPGGLIRTRGVHWESVAWGEVVRFDDCTLSGNGVLIRQCRVITAAGKEWGFQADLVADFDRLASHLRANLTANGGTPLDQ
jgi:hypothetical protein